MERQPLLPEEHQENYQSTGLSPVGINFGAFDWTPTQPEDENAPLAFYFLSRSVSGGTDNTGTGSKSLNTFFGVVIPCILSMFSAILFLRMGYVVGQSGVILSITIILIAYLIIFLTVLSISAISTNGAVEVGGPYFMISRALGPEFGGAIGVMFYLANVFASASYFIALSESLTADFNIPSGFWFKFLYCSCLLLMCLAICLVGAKMFARTTFVIFIIVMGTVLSVVISFFTKPVGSRITIPQDNPYYNGTVAYYRGINMVTFKENLFQNFTIDYTTNTQATITSVFAIFFNGVTGIMAGANMSGDLKNPSKSIPNGTLIAVAFTFAIYVIISLLILMSCDRFLLLNDYGFLQGINSVPPLVAIGIVAATLSAALSCLIGSSRILYALAKDDIFGVILRPISRYVANDSPYAAVVVSWFVIQIILIIGELNVIAPIVSIFFLLAYSAINLACMALDIASAPNFRPTFSYFHWVTSLLGLIGCMTMMFLIQPSYAGGSVLLMVFLVVIIHYREPPISWGSISQALIFHQVRKYLLLLDIRKDHVKFWRPQILLLVSDLDTGTGLISFVNDLKKSGLFVLGNVCIGDMDDQVNDSVQEDYNKWLFLVDQLRVKAFVEVTMASSVRLGAQQLMRIAGLGGMKPNTIIVGFYESEDFKQRSLDIVEYVSMIRDAIKLRKNICLARHFSSYNKTLLFDNPGKIYIDIWPINIINPTTNGFFDTTSLLLLQLSCILNMVSSWKKRSVELRIFLCIDLAADVGATDQVTKLRQLLAKLRIPASVEIVQFGDILPLAKPDSLNDSDWPDRVTDDYLNAVNSVVQSRCQTTAVVFFYLPLPPADQFSQRYMDQLEIATSGFPPTLFVHGVSAVTSVHL